MKKLIIALVATLLAVSGLQAHAGPEIYKDEYTFDNWYQQEVRDLYSYNIMSGYDDGTFRPGNTVNRAELGVMIYRLLLKLELRLGLDLRAWEECIEGEYEPDVQLSVYGYTGEPITGAKVELAQRTYISEKFQNFFSLDEDNGHYFKDGLYPGQYTLRISKPGYRTYYDTLDLQRGRCGVYNMQKTVMLPVSI